MAKLTRSKILRDWQKLDNFPLQQRSINKIYKIIAFLEDKPQSIGGIAKHLNITKNDATNLIKQARAYMIKFQNPTGRYYLTTDWNNVWLTDNKAEISMEIDILEGQLRLTEMQLLQAKLLLINNRKKGKTNER